MPGPKYNYFASVQSGSFSQRKLLAKKVLYSLKNIGYVYGDYVKNEVAGDDFDVINFFSPRFAATDTDIRGAIVSLGFTAELLNNTVVERNANRFTETLFKIFNPNNYSSIFIKIRRPLDNGNIPFVDTYSNVNHLMKNNDGTYAVHADMFGNESARETILENILSDIKNKRFRLWGTPSEDDCREEFDNLLENGYRFLAGKSFNENVNENSSVIDNHNVTDNFTKPFGEGKSDTTMWLKDAQPLDKSGWLDPVLDKDIVSKTNPCCEIELQANSAMDSFKNEMNKAVYRSVSCQLTNLIKSNIISFMKENGTDKNKLDIVAELLNTTGGTAVVSAMLGISLPYVPKIGEDPRVAILAEEFRVAGYSVAMDTVFSALMQYIAPEIIKAMKTLPPVETKRIVIDDLPQTVDDNELIEDEIDEETLTVSL